MRPTIEPGRNDSVTRIRNITQLLQSCTRNSGLRRHRHRVEKLPALDNGFALHGRNGCQVKIKNGADRGAEMQQEQEGGEKHDGVWGATTSNVRM